MKQPSPIGNRLQRPVRSSQGLVETEAHDATDYHVLRATPLEPPRESGPSIGDFLSVIRRRKWIVVSTTVLIAALAAVFAFTVKPLYTAEGLLLLATEKSQITDVKAVITGLPLEAATVRSEIEILKSPAMAQKVTEKLKLWDEPAYQPDPRAGILAYAGLQIDELRHWIGLDAGDDASPESKEAWRRKKIAAAVSGNLDAIFDGRSYVVRLRFSSPDPELAARIINTFMEIRAGEQQLAKSDATRRGRDWLEERLNELRTEVQTADRAVEEYRAANKLTSSQAKGVTLTAQQLTELNSQLVLASAERSQKEATLRQIRELLKSPGGAATAGQVLASPIIQQLSQQETDVSRRAAEASTIYGDKHPVIAKLRSEDDELRRRMSSEVGKVVRNLASELTIAQSREAQLKTRLNEVQNDNNIVGAAEIRLLELQRQADATRRIYETFLTRQLETKGQEQIVQPDGRIVSAAQPPLDPSYPQKTLLVGLASSAGLFIGGLLAFVRERLDHGFRQSSEVESVTGLRALGFVPAMRRAETALSLLSKEPRSSFSEAVRSIRTSLSTADPDIPGKVVLVTSSVAGEGKSLLAASLARSVALSGDRVLLVDCDFRRPSVAKLLRDQGGPGFAEFLIGESPIADVLRRDEPTGLNYISCGDRSRIGSPQDVFASPAMRKFISSARLEYDVVMLDAPPVLPVSDAVALARHADSSIFVIRWRRTPRDAVQNALQILGTAIIPIAGAVLSRVNIKKQAKLGFRDSAAYHGRYGAAYYR